MFGTSIDITSKYKLTKLHLLDNSKPCISVVYTYGGSYICMADTGAWFYTSYR